MNIFYIYYEPISHIKKILEGLKVGGNRYFWRFWWGSTVLATENSGNVSSGHKAFCASQKSNFSNGTGGQQKVNMMS